MTFLWAPGHFSLPPNPVAVVSVLQVSKLKPGKDKSSPQSRANFMWKNKAQAGVTLSTQIWGPVVLPGEEKR